MNNRPPLPPFTLETALQKVQLAEEVDQIADAYRYMESNEHTGKIIVTTS